MLGREHRAFWSLCVATSTTTLGPLPSSPKSVSAISFTPCAKELRRRSPLAWKPTAYPVSAVRVNLSADRVRTTQRTIRGRAELPTIAGDVPLTNQFTHLREAS